MIDGNVKQEAHTHILPIFPEMVGKLGKSTGKPLNRGRIYNQGAGLTNPVKSKRMELHCSLRDHRLGCLSHILDSTMEL